MSTNAVIAVIVVVVLIVGLVLLFGAVAGFNALRRLDVKASEALGGIDVELHRRSDLVPNLVATVQGYATHERETFEAVTRARAAATAAADDPDVTRKAAAEAGLDRAIVDVLAVAEQYPQLQASQNFQALQAELSETENRLAFARQYYNDAVSSLNQKVVTFPWLLLTGVAGVRSRDFYRVPDGGGQVPQVSF